MKMKRRTSVGSPKKAFILFITLLLLGGSLWFYLSTRHYQIRSITRTYMYYEKSGDYGSSWNLLHSTMKKNMTQAQYVQVKSQLYLQDFKASGFSYKIRWIRHLASWHPTTSSLSLKDVYKVRLYQTFNSQFGRQTIISTLYLARDKTSQNKWRILWE